MNEKLKEILSKVDPSQDFFTESIQNDLVKLFESKIESKDSEITTLKESHEASLLRLDESYQTKLEEGINKLDEDHTVMMEEVVAHIDKVHTRKMKAVLEAVDQDRTDKLERAINKIDEDHTLKLQNIINMYESTYSDTLVDKVSDYLDVYLEEILPEEKAIDLAKLSRLEEMFSDMRQLLVVTDDFVQTEIKEAVEDAKTQLDEKADQINGLMLEKIKLNKKLEKLEAKALLKDRTNTMTMGEKAYVSKFFENCSTVEIEEQFDEAVRAYEDDMNRKRQHLLKEEKKKTSKINLVQESADPKPVLNEDVNESPDMMMDAYVHKINRSITASR